MKYLLAYTIPIAVFLSLEMQGFSSFIALFYAFGLLPLLEFFLPATPSNLPTGEEALALRRPFYDWLLRTLVPIQFFLLHRFLSRMQEPPAHLLEAAGLISAMGVSCGVIGINVAHELGHRNLKADRILARILLSTSLYWQFYVEHNRGHHKNVSTPGDPESSRLGESLYAFWIRSVRDSFLSAWRLDAEEMTIGLGIQALMTVGIAMNYGAVALLGFLMSSLFGILLLQSVNYIEHYGLARRRLPAGGFETVRPDHSWNSDHPLSRAVLFELSRHSDHHANATRKYPVLRHLEPSPQLPAGYPTMILLALIPPLWFSVMDSRIPKVQDPSILTES